MQDRECIVFERTRDTDQIIHEPLVCDHALYLYLCNLFSGGGHDTFLLQITCKKPESGLFSDWIGNNTDDLRCSDWPKRRHPLVVVDFSLHFCLRITEQ